MCRMPLAGRTVTEPSKPLTLAQRQALHRQRRAEREDKMRDAMERAIAAKTLREARAILAAALKP